MVWRDTPALRGEGFGFLLDYNWIKRGGLGCWGVAAEAAVCSSVILRQGLCVALRHILLLLSSDCQSWGHKLRRAKWPSGLTRSQACSANGATTADGAGCVLPHSTVGGRGEVMQSLAPSGQFFLSAACPVPSPALPQSGGAQAGPGSSSRAVCGAVVGAPSELGRSPGAGTLLLSGKWLCGPRVGQKEGLLPGASALAVKVWAEGAPRLRCFVPDALLHPQPWDSEDAALTPPSLRQSTEFGKARLFLS